MAQIGSLTASSSQLMNTGMSQFNVFAVLLVHAVLDCPAAAGRLPAHCMAHVDTTRHGTASHNVAAQKCVCLEDSKHSLRSKVGCGQHHFVFAGSSACAVMLDERRNECAGKLRIVAWSQRWRKHRGLRFVCSSVVVAQSSSPSQRVGAICEHSYSLDAGSDNQRVLRCGHWHTSI
eukprot:4573543-Amphidinium_carterae.1